MSSDDKKKALAQYRLQQAAESLGGGPLSLNGRKKPPIRRQPDLLRDVLCGSCSFNLRTLYLLQKFGCQEKISKRNQAKGRVRKEL